MEFNESEVKARLQKKKKPELVAELLKWERMAHKKGVAMWYADKLVNVAESLLWDYEKGRHDEDSVDVDWDDVDFTHSRALEVMCLVTGICKCGCGNPQNMCKKVVLRNLAEGKELDDGQAYKRDDIPLWVYPEGHPCYEQKPIKIGKK